LSLSQQRKSWIPAFAGMTEGDQHRWVNHYAGWHLAGWHSAGRY